MDRSLGFGSTPSNYGALLRLGFPSAPLYELNLAAERNSLTHYAKGTPSHLIYMVLLLLVGIRFQVLFHPPYWSAFHLSLTVLVHYRSESSI